MIEICAHCVFELDPVNATVPGMYQDYEGHWEVIQPGKVIDIVVVEGRPVKTAYGLALHPDWSLVLFRGTLLCPVHFRGQFSAALARKEVSLA